MNFSDLNKKIENIIELSIELAKMDYSDPKYDKLEDKIHDLQDAINDDYGDDFDVILDEIYDKFNIQDETMFLADYIGSKYKELPENKFGKQFEIDINSAALVEIDSPKLANKKINAAVYIHPNPLSLIMNINGLERIMWSAPNE